MQKGLTAHEHPVRKVFSSDFEFKIPDYQRPYRWGTDQAVQLLDDLDESLTRSAEWTPTTRALQVAWDAVLALEDYVRARQEGVCSQGLDHYFQHTPAGFTTFPPGKFGETETGITMRQFGDERIFPVPTHVDPSGYVAMKAHFKLARIGMATPPHAHSRREPW